MASTDASPDSIVGLGASAGGLQALEEFLASVPVDSGLAFIVVQHLDPHHKALLPELLQRVTRMPVQEAHHGMTVAPGHVYVIPPNTELTLEHNQLRLAPPREPRGRRLPVDVLFSSMARALEDNAIGVVLSGMGADGTLGLQAIKAVGGLTLVQSPRSAQFDAMPRNAINAGSADLVAPPEELPARILEWLGRVERNDHRKEPQPLDDAHQQSLQQILQLVRNHSGGDFSQYKPSSLNRRIERRMAIHGLATLARYRDYLLDNPQELSLLFRELLIGVTGFFRDTAAWEKLAVEILPSYLSGFSEAATVRVWSVGCSTGEEAYSLAMVLTEAMERLPKGPPLDLQVFATDLSGDAIARARRGRYPLSLRDTLSPQRLERFFQAHEGYYQVRPELRSKVLFAQHDLLLDPPFTRLDLIACRNLLIYFDAQLQRRLLPLFHYCLRPRGLLMLGNAESTGRMGYLFRPLDARLRLFQRLERQETLGDRSQRAHSLIHFANSNKEPPVPSSQPPGTATENLQSAAEQILLQVYAPPAVVVNRDGDIVYISGRTGNYLEPAAGKANWNIAAMARDGLLAPIMQALQQALGEGQTVQLAGESVQLPEGELAVDVTVHPFNQPAALQNMAMVLFRERDDRPALPPAPERGQREPQEEDAGLIRRYQQEIESLRAQARHSREELQSTNEALQSSNEELQSANEELTTSKEEMQSMNEELQTINNELQTKLDDLAQAQSDMQNVLNSIEIAILFLDQNLNVRRYTNRAAQIINLRERDLGRPLSDLTSHLQYPELSADV